MQTPRDEAERVQYWVSLGQQPGVSAWFTIWQVVYRKRVQPAKAARPKGMGREQCTA